MVKNLVRRLFGGVFRQQTLGMIWFDLLRLKARWKSRLKKERPASPKLHLACGIRRAEGWLNVDVRKSDFDVDLVSGRLPWPVGVFECVVGQHFIAELEIEGELIPLLKELRRVLKPNGELWLSTPDMEKICRSYIEDGGAALLADRRTRMPGFSVGGYPDSHYLNAVFFERGRNVNLLDFPLLREVLRRAGFGECRRMDEYDLLERFPGFPPRRDDFQSLYILAVKSGVASTLSTIETGRTRSS